MLAPEHYAFSSFMQPQPLGSLENPVCTTTASASPQGLLAVRCVNKDVLTSLKHGAQVSLTEPLVLHNKREDTRVCLDDQELLLVRSLYSSVEILAVARAELPSEADALEPDEYDRPEWPLYEVHGVSSLLEMGSMHTLSAYPIEGCPLAFVWSKDCRYLLAASAHGEVVAVDLATMRKGKVPLRQEAEESGVRRVPRVTAMEMSPDEKYVAVAMATGSQFAPSPTDGTKVLVCDVATLVEAALSEVGEPLTSFVLCDAAMAFHGEGKWRSIFHVAWSHDSSMLAFYPTLECVVVADMASCLAGEPNGFHLEVPKEFTGVNVTCFSPDSRWLVVAFDDNRRVRVFDTSTWEMRAHLEMPPKVDLEALRVGDPVDAKDIVATWYQAEVRAMTDTRDAASICFSMWAPKWDELLSIHSRKLEPCGTHSTVPYGSRAGFRTGNSLAFSLSGQYLIICITVPRVYDTTTWQCIHRMPVDRIYRNVALSQDARYLACSEVATQRISLFRMPGAFQLSMESALSFLMGMHSSDSAVSQHFAKNELFDRNAVKLLFSFLSGSHFSAGEGL